MRTRFQGNHALMTATLMAFFAFSALYPAAVSAHDNAAIGSPCAARSSVGESCGPTGSASQGTTCQSRGSVKLCLYRSCNDDTPCPSNYECRSVTDAGGDYQACFRADTVGTTQVLSERSADLNPVLGIPIPNLTFSNIQVVQDGNKQYIDIPWYADYVVAAYRYAVGAAAVIGATLMMMGGFQYLTAGGDSGRVTAAKKRITDALIGLFLVIASYLLLNTINPNLVLFNALRLQVIQKKTFTVIPASQIRAVTGSDPLERQEMIDRAKMRAEAMGGRDFACFVYGSMVHESGGRMNAIGHDENANTTVFSVGARQRFISSGVKGSGSTFTAVPCSSRTCQNQGPLNDDSINLENPPDYGLDWRFSHGFGSGQSTIFPHYSPCAGKEAEGRGFTVGGNCYSVRDLMNPDRQIEAMLTHYQRCWQSGGSGDNVARSYVCYAGRIAEDNPIIQARVQVYNTCRGGS